MDYNNNTRPVAKIIVIGVGGAGNNAVNRMIDEEIQHIDFYVMNTDEQTLENSKTENAKQLTLGKELTKGLGAGGLPEVGQRAAEASREEIRRICEGANMIFIAAGMGGGTGTGAAPVVASIAKECGALTVAIVTRPFQFEGKMRLERAIKGLQELKKYTDSIIVVSNDKLLMTNGNETIGKAFEISDKVLAQSVKTITDLIFEPATINLDFADVKNTLKDSGVALIGLGFGTGPKKAEEAANRAIESPLLEASVSGARRAICAITCGKNVSLMDTKRCIDLIIDATGTDLDVKFGVSINNELTDEIWVSIIAGDFKEEYDFTKIPDVMSAPFVSILDENETSEEVIEDDEEEALLPNFLGNR